LSTFYRKGYKLWLFWRGFLNWLRLKPKNLCWKR